MSLSETPDTGTTTTPADILRGSCGSHGHHRIVGMGYVGMPLAHAVLEAGFSVLDSMSTTRRS